MEYKKRVADQMLADKLEASGAVLVEGPKYCGKTTLSKQQAKSVLSMADPDTLGQNLALARTNITRLLVRVPHYVLDNMKDTAKLYGIGTKNYGQCNEKIYRNRNKQEYFETAVAIDPSYLELNKEWKASWGENYVDFIGVAEKSPGKVKVFTLGGKFISQDCEHLTQQGAVWYGSMINWEKILQINMH